MQKCTCLHLMTPACLQYGYILPEKEKLNFKVYFRCNPSMILRYVHNHPIIIKRMQHLKMEHCIYVCYSVHVQYIKVYIAKKSIGGAYISQCSPFIFAHSAIQVRVY